MKSKLFNPSKWSKTYLTWWDSLSIDEQVNAKKKFVKQSIVNQKSKNPYPDMPDVSHLRLSQLTDAHKYRIWVFKDRDENLK